MERLREGEAVLATLARLDPDLVDEHLGLADGLGCRPETIAALWARRTPAPERAGCTLFAAADPRHQRTLVGRNFDLRVEDIERRLLIYRPSRESIGEGSGPAAGEPSRAAIGGCGGLVGRLDGVNGRGLAAAAAEVFVDDPGAFWGPAGPPAGALDCSLVLRIILDRCATVGEAVALAREVPQWTAFNFLVADRTGDMAVVEYAGPWTQVRRPRLGGSHIAATNHYESPSLRGCSRNGSLTHRRYTRVLEALGAIEAVTPETFEGILSSPGVHQRHITLWSIVLDPGDGLIYLAPGRPDRNPYRRFEVDGRTAYAEEISVIA